VKWDPPLAGVLAAALAIALALLLTGGSGGHRGGNRTGAVMIGAAAGPGVRITVPPVGLSVEYPVLAAELGARRCPPAALVRAIRGLGSPTLRIGGDSQDETAPAGTPPTPGVHDLPRGFWSRLACLERETGISVVVGLNLASRHRAWAATLAAQARSAVPRSRLSFSLGNEPDIYGVHVPWWTGHSLVSRHMVFDTYEHRALDTAALLPPGSAIEGPDFASGRWIRAVPVLVRRLRLRTLDAHFYPLDACHTTAGDTTAALLSRGVQLRLDERVRLARDARAAGLPAVISETNSISCGGVRGVSDGRAAAVWAVRLVLTALRSGFAEVRFHSSGASYDPFLVRRGRLFLRPMYLGLREAAALLPPGALLRAIPGAGALDGVEVTAPDGGSTTLLSNYGAAGLWVSVAATRGPVRVVEVLARAPVVRSVVVAVAGGRARVELPPDSVDAVQSGAST
jgi:hypothetical protein